MRRDNHMSARGPGDMGTVGIIGVGRAGSAVGSALVAAGYEVTAVYARTSAGRGRAAVLFPAARMCATPAEAAALAQMVLLGVPDDRIGDVAAEVAAGLAPSGVVGPAAAPPRGALPGAGGPGGRVSGARLVAHLSGRHGTAPLGPVRALGAHLAAVHPIMTLTGTAHDAGRLAGTTFGVTTDPGDEAASDLVARLVADIGGRIAVVPEEQRTIYHAALVLGGNFLATLVTAAGRLLAQAGVADPTSALGPLLRASLENTLAAGEAAMTGPVRRGDVGTVLAQRAELEALDPHLAAAYAALATLTADRLEHAGLLEPAAATAVRLGLTGSAGTRM